MTLKRKLGRYTVESLEAAGVRHVFGIPGVHNLELYRGLVGSTIRHITGRNEQGLGFMADGYARVSRSVGVCFTISGPGLTNIATAMGQAYADSIPLLVIATELNAAEMGRGALHELTDQLAIAARLSGTSERIATAEDLPGALARAFAAMSSKRPRPAYIGIPRDLLALEVELPPYVPTGPARALAPGADIATAAHLLAGAKAPVVLAGGGAIDAARELRQLVEKIGAPLVMTANARGLLPPDHPLAVSISPSLRFVRSLVTDADVVLAVGTEMGPTDYDWFANGFPQPSTLVRIDIDEGQLRRNAEPALGLCGDAASTLRAILQLDLGADSTRATRGAARASATRDEAFAKLPGSMLRQVALLALIRDRAPGAIIVGDSTQPVYSGNAAFAAATPGSWFNSATGYGTLGYALSASIGAALAAPERPVVCLIGDGGIQFALGDLGVARDVDAWLAIVVWNNVGYGEIKTSMLEAQIPPAGVDIRPPDFELIAEAYGYEHRLIDDEAAFDRALQSFAARRQVVVLEMRAQGFE